MENTITWILIADASKARLFAVHKARLFQDDNTNNLQLISEFTHNDSRKKGSDLVSDKMGEFGSGSFAATTSPKAHEAEQFAQELVTHLDTGRKENSFRDFILVAPPAFMGLLHKHMHQETKKLLSQSIEKDYTHDEGRVLLTHLLSHF